MAHAETNRTVADNTLVAIGDKDRRKLLTVEDLPKQLQFILRTEIPKRGVRRDVKVRNGDRASKPRAVLVLEQV